MATYLVEVNDTCTVWRENAPDGRIHRLDGPAVEYTDGTKAYMIYGKRHRLDGPAVVYSDGGETFWIDGVQLTPDEFHAAITNRIDNYDTITLKGVDYLLVPKRV